LRGKFGENLVPGRRDHHSFADRDRQIAIGAQLIGV